ncbi:uncharacterized protein TRIADDRAFT_59726 [Trichoplax adhaerens]|uniref:Uncharacterized protein n=1 Tax=Trichoplax adhaerens TaxID=10228 RepID=B3S695_TRIAD|nr:hypothetical protein TRIADDRAFT_59726 [Trichoplax adhaerens]EDV21584.1 hypothetical protein TRIADDRAFT_59726 [Trichoplax adhaerens]|eukprot:XP_002115732.1 hypothetical protein TRIADDRAFT_59726 [Trichoplax adhaerens]
MEGAKGSDKPRPPDPIYVLRSIKSPVTDLNIALLSNMQSFRWSNRTMELGKQARYVVYQWAWMFFVMEGMVKLMFGIYAAAESIRVYEPALIHVNQITIKNIWNGENVHKLNISNDGGLGMCMYSKCIVNEHYGRPYIMAGYECGDIILWDVAERKPLCQNKCFNEPDLTSTYAHGLVGSVERAITTVEINNMVQCCLFINEIS